MMWLSLFKVGGKMKKNNYLTLGGLFIALHLLFVFLSKVLVGSELILVVFLPLLSTIYSLKFGIKETIMFFISAFLLTLLFEPIAACIYVLPALICGVVYGLARKRNVKELSLVYFSSLSHSIALFISFAFISLMFKEVEFFNIFANFLNKEGEELYASIYLILMLIGVLEAFVTHIITNNELKKLGYKELEEDRETPMWINVGFILSLLLYVVLAFIKPIASVYCFPYLLAFTIPLVVEFVLRNESRWLYFVCMIVMMALLFVIPYLNPIFYPSLLIWATIPLILKKFFIVLYTKSIKYSNNG